MTILAIITARGGSKGLPGKNIRTLAGKPLIAWSIQAALGSKAVTDTVVSTDDEEIARVSREWGAEVPFMRPSELAGDESPHIPVLLHALDWMKSERNKTYDYVLLLQPTSPMRTAGDLDQAAGQALGQNADALVGVCESFSHPFLIKKIDEKGCLENFAPVPEGYLRRQSFPDAYVLNGALYLIRTSVLREQKTLLPSGVRPFMMPQERSLDIDSLADFEITEFLMTRKT